MKCKKCGGGPTYAGLCRMCFMAACGIPDDAAARAAAKRDARRGRPG